MNKQRIYSLSCLLAFAVIGAGCSQGVRQDEISATRLPPSSSDSILYNTMVAEIAGHRGALEESVRHYQKAVEQTVQVPIIRRAARIMMFARDFSAANKAIGKWLNLQPESMEAHQLAATAYLRQDDLQGAMPHLEWVLARAGTHKYTVVAAFLERSGKPELSLQAMASMVNANPKDINAQITYARMAFNNQEYQAALDATAAAIALDNSNSDAHLIHARARMELGDIDQALDSLKVVVDDTPGDHELRLGYARMLVSANRYESAVEEFEKLIEAKPDDNADLVYSTALILLQIKRYTDAERYLRQLAGVRSHQQEAHYYLGRLEEDRRNLAKAMDWYNKVEEGSLYVESQMSSARIQAKLGDVQQARKNFEILRKNYPSLAPRIYLGESEMLRDIKQDQLAYDLLDEAVRAFPEDIDLIYSRALAAERIDRIDILERDLKEVLRRKPDHAHALNALGYTLADRTDRYIEALAYIERALQLDPTDPAIIDSMGWVQYRMGNIELALTYLRRALASFHDSEIAAHLGEVLWVSGQQDAAMEVWDRALNEFPDSEILRRAIQRFRP